MGTSCLQVTLGLLVLIIAILAGVMFHLSAIPPDVHIQIDPTSTSLFLLLGKSAASKTLTSQQLEEYHRDGVVFIKSLLSEEEALELKQSAEYASSRLFDVFGLFGNSRYKKVMFDLWRTSPEISSLSLQALPQVASQLMMTTTKSTKAEEVDDHTPLKSIRLLRDAYFAYSPPGEACGWHVDDAGFWPAQEDTTGPTFWITLDPLRVNEGGGLAVLNRTLFHETEPLEVTEETCRQAIAGATCEMPEKSPLCHAKMEATKMEFDMQPGDAILWDRWTFHRGVGGTELLAKDAVKQRYSVRYMPQGSKAFGAVHSSIGQGDLFESPYYPQVWPNLLESEMKALEHGLDSDVSLVAALQFMSKRMAKKFKLWVFPEKQEATDEQN
jgi:hypothetical protein